MPQKFNIPLRPLHRGEGQAENFELQLVRKGNKIVQHLFVGGFFPDDALFAHLLLPRFKLGLDQAEHLPGGLQQCFDHGQNQL